jgi:glycosyltransferase involved in cell wall biosynthesis
LASVALGDVATAPKLSLTEGAGKILNYMAVGLPVVAFDTPVAREYLGSDGLFATRGDVDSLAYYLRSCLFPPSDSPDTYLRMGQRLRQRAIQQFSWEAAGHTIIETYEELLGDTSSRVVPSPNWAATHQ